VTGSLNASVAQWLFATGRASGCYVAAQGTRLGCHGRIVLTEDAEGVWVGGNTVTIASGSLGL
jgi:predicted PhzF superfamily epimerase YddE/YHI9